MFGWAAKWKRNPTDRLTRLAEAIEAVAETDRRVVAESAEVDLLRSRGAVELHRICRAFVDSVNARLTAPAMRLDPPSFSEDNYHDEGMNLFQINLRGRVLQIDFEPTAELQEDDDFRKPYVLRGAVRSYNQDQLAHSSIDEQMIFFCPANEAGLWYFFDGRTYRSGPLTEHYLITEMEKLL